MNQLLILFFLLFVNMGCADDGASPFPAAYKLGNVVASPIKKAQQTDDEVRQALDKLSSIIKSDAQRQVLLKLLEEQKMQVEKSQDDSPVVTSDFVQHFSNHVQAFIQRFFSAFTEIKGYIKDFKTVEKKVLARFQFICFLLFNLILCLIVERMIRKFIKRRVVIDDQENILPKGVLRWLLGDVIPFIGFVLLFVFLCSFLRAVPYLQDLWFMKVSMRHSIFTSFLSYLLLYRSIILVVRFFSLLAKDIQNRSLDLIQSKPGSMAHNVRYFVYVHSFFMMSSLMVNQSRPRQAWVFLVNFSFACVLAVVLSFSKEKLIRFVDRFLTSYPWSSAGIVGVFLRNLYAVLFFTLVLVFLGWCYPPLNGLASFVEAFYLTVFLFFLMKAGENMSLKYRFFLMRKLNVFVKKPSLKPLVTNRKLADSMRAFIRISRWFAYFVIFSLTLSIWGAKFFSPFFVHLTYEKVILAAATFIVLLIASLLWGGITTLSNKHFSKLDLLSGEDRSHLFMKTITPIIRRFLHGLVVFLAVIVVLQMWGIDTTVLIYATSIISLAVSFGAQGLVKDIINGITALFDRKIAIGEVVTIGNHTGTVEEVHLRSLVIRHFNGALQTIPFSEVTSMINLSRDYSVCSVDLPVNYSASLEKVIDVCRRAFLKLKQSEDFGEKIIDDMNISGIDRFAEEGIHLAISFRTKPDPGRKISKALNKLIHDSMSSSDDFRPIQYLVNVPVSKKQGTT